MRAVMVTSRDTGGRVIPKDWLMDRKSRGAVGCMSSTAIGTYHYIKQLDDGRLCAVA